MGFLNDGKKGKGGEGKARSGEISGAGGEAAVKQRGGEAKLQGEYSHRPWVPKWQKCGVGSFHRTRANLIP